MVETGRRSDMGVGLAALFGLLGLGGVLVMYLYSHSHLLAGWGFAVAMFAATVAIAAIHLYD